MYGKSNLPTNDSYEVTSLSVDACSGICVLGVLHLAPIFCSVKSPCTTATSVIQITSVSET